MAFCSLCLSNRAQMFKPPLALTVVRGLNRGVKLLCNGVDLERAFYSAADVADLTARGFAEAVNKCLQCGEREEREQFKAYSNPMNQADPRATSNAALTRV